jgi:hypothetical protein
MANYIDSSLLELASAGDRNAQVEIIDLLMLSVYDVVFRMLPRSDARKAKGICDELASNPLFWSQLPRNPAALRHYLVTAGVQAVSNAGYIARPPVTENVVRDIERLEADIEAAFRKYAPGRPRQAFILKHHYGMTDDGLCDLFGIDKRQLNELFAQVLRVKKGLLSNMGCDQR